jgi:hypothetical protein
MKKNNTSAGWEKTKAVLKTIGNVFAKIGIFIFRIRSVLMAAPVVYAAVRLAMYAQENLPEQVGINLKETGEYAMLVSRDTAIMGSLAVTALCLLMMFISRRTIYPWLISIFSLVLPILLIVTNIFPA